MYTHTWTGTVGRIAAWTGMAGTVLLLSGCAYLWHPSPARPVITARYTAVPIQLDGALDDAAWQAATAYPLQMSVAELGEGKKLTEVGEARVTWDDQFLYVGVKFTDSDIVAEGQEDQLHHYLMGDLAEVFLKPIDRTWYWEMYVTPAGRKTTLWFPGRGRLGLKSSEDNPGGLRVAAQCQGTLNRWQDEDTSWTGEVAIPVQELTARGETFGAGANWTLMVSRYNYGRYLSWKELSMTPRLSKTNYHLWEEYAILELVK